MKKFLFLALGLLALPVNAQAVVVTVGGVTLTFDAPPATTDFTTNAAALTGDGATVTDNATMDTLVQGITAASISAAITTTTTAPPSTNVAFRHNGTALALQSQPTTTPAAILLGKLTNGTSNYITDVGVSYSLAELLEAGEVSSEMIAGHRAYYSTTGAANSWTAIGNFGTAGPVSFNINGLGTSFGNNTLYLLLADDNGPGGGTSGEATYHIDNMNIAATALGGPLAPPTPEFGSVAPNQAQGFDGPGLTFNNGAQGTPTAIQGDNALQVNGTALNAATDQVDLRSINFGTHNVVVGVDLKAWESSATSDFEAADRVAVIAEWSADGITFQNLSLIDVVGAPALTPFDPLVPNPADQIRATFGPTEAQNNIDAPFVHREVTLPSNADTVRVRVILQTDSGTEFMAVDNITVTAVPVPEPASVAMIGLGMIGLVGYGIRRRRSA
jgi:hypothetical protein